MRKLGYFLGLVGFGLAGGSIASLLLRGVSDHLWPTWFSAGLLSLGVMGGSWLFVGAIMAWGPSGSVRHPVSAIVSAREYTRAQSEGRAALARVTEVFFKNHSESSGAMYRMSFVVVPSGGAPYAAVRSIPLDPLLAKTVEVGSIVAVVTELRGGGKVGLVRDPVPAENPHEALVRAAQPVEIPPPAPLSLRVKVQIVLTTIVALAVGAVVALLPLIVEALVAR